MADHVTVEALTALLGASTDPARAEVAVTATNALIDVWVGAPAAPAPGVWRARWDQLRTGQRSQPAPLVVEVTPASSQAGLELAHTLYRRHAATGGFVGVDELLARLPADLVRGIRDLLDADSHSWGVA